MKTNILKNESPVFSYFKKPITNTKPSSSVTIRTVYELIAGDSFKQATVALRSKTDTAEAKKYKSQAFDYVTFSGVFNTRADNAILSSSGLIVIDIDHIQNIASIKETLLNDPYFETELLFTSPSGDGIKWVVSLDLSQANHAEYFTAISNYLMHTYQIKVDKAGSDLSRACFLPHDPDAYINPNTTMEKKTFNVQEWLNSNNLLQNSSKETDVEFVLNQIEAGRIDLTEDYSDWVKLGFAIVSEFGETGRSYFHRLSKNYTNYDYAECDKQYTECLEGKGSGTNIGTFFHKAKIAGLNIGIASAYVDNHLENEATELESERYFDTPTIPESIYSNLPPFLSDCTGLFEEEKDKDITLISSVVVLSACFPNVEGIYMRDRYSSHLYAIITAPAGSGKGIMKWSRLLGQPLHEEMVRNYEIERMNASKPELVKRKLFYLPVNSSSTAFIQGLKDNNFNAVLFDTEIDTLVNSFRQEWGNYSDVLRKAFHHDNTSFIRRKDNEYEEIKDPHIAIMLSGTPNQILRLMPNPEDGLFSRFLYYAFNGDPQFKNPFTGNDEVDYSAIFLQKGEEIAHIYKLLLKRETKIQFKYTREQGEIFTATFQEMSTKNKLLMGADFDANIKRLGLITFRISMCLSCIRNMSKLETIHTITCDDIDFKTAMAISMTLEKHAMAVYNKLPKGTMKEKHQLFYDKLPKEFNRADYLKTATELKIEDKNAQKYIKRYKDAGLLLHTRNYYQKTESRSFGK